ncbi:hypothetical protein BDZ97DRAFT_1925751 [Flammula alnicola]|nr:hypothetical protein BDZ97DRAFT_1925751 [Flammula alnicola]
MASQSFRRSGEEAQPERRKLPQVWRQAMWHPRSGLIVSPSHRTLPSDLVLDAKSTKPSDYLKPRFLSDDNIYLAFYPTRPLHRGYLFGDLALSGDDLRLSIHADNHNGRPMYILDSRIREKWYRLENSLLAVTETLITAHPQYLTLPPLKYPRWPYQYGYTDFHLTREKAFLCARRSLSAFSMVIAVTSFALSLWLTEYEDDCFEGAFTVLSHRQRDKLPRVWLNYLKESIVCNLSPGVRPGCFLDPHMTRWGGYLYLFTRASVPIWLIWGQDDENADPVDLKMAHYFPPPEYIELAKKRYISFSNVILPSQDTYYLEGHAASRESIPPPGSSIRLPPSQSASGVDEGHGLDFIDFVDNAGSAFANPNHYEPPPAPPAIDRTQIVEKDSGQRPGESWEQFSARMEQILERRIETETEKDRQSRKAMEAVALATGPTKHSGVFLWEQDKILSSFYRRTRLTRAEARSEWSECTKYQRRYWSHRNEWDLCRHLPLHPPDVPRSEIEEPDSDEEGSLFPDDPHLFSEVVSQLKTPTDGPVGPMMLRMVRALTARDEEPGSDEYDRFVPLVDYLRRRHGFFADLEESWNPNVHEKDGKLSLGKDQLEASLRNLLYSSVSTTLPSWVFTSIVDFHNTALRTNLQYTALPGSWDLSPNSRTTRSLVCDMSQICLQRVASDLPFSTDVYILRPPKGSRDRSPWFVATTSATAVLLVYRSAWTTMHEIGSGLLELGIPFRTVIEKKRTDTDEFVERKWRYKTKGLGGRPKDFQPTEEDFLAYEHARDDVLRSACGRAIRLRGGIAGRIASELVSDTEVLDGPLCSNEVVGHHGDIAFVDDKVDEGSLDIVCGIYVVNETDGGSVVSHASWWPKQTTWMGTGLAGDQWLPRAEEFYKKRLSELRSGNPKLVKASLWKDKLKFRRVATNRIHDGSERMAAAFLSQDKRVH